MAALAVEHHLAEDEAEQRGELRGVAGADDHPHARHAGQRSQDEVAVGCQLVQAGAAEGDRTDRSR